MTYTRLLSEIFHQGKLLQTLQHVGVAFDEDLGTWTERILSGMTLGYMKIIEKKNVVTSEQNFQASMNQSALMDDFPPISREDPSDVLAHFIAQHYKKNGYSNIMGYDPRSS